ncbi:MULTISPECIES: LysR substrate-binding domain-containing protein [Stappiaceae]|uniref:HTH-type transcriptional regulator YofA n=1 Tax=Roseibium aggregatum TaxID=187304 RepID=A0A0M6Y3H3_9HYPH|nr:MULTISPECIES: LysR substrate-binding domain-containing protein [Stappiaceae]QFS96656.1 HTH-type transcriptional regulator YofA [Labrenzia sp. THAF191b]QFT02971.1 HTH-type transcriptional regulator YofA [Labrenzia sp. THAF191a]QFT14513.1 HTH-type transcriptional regulator YofA [Labrenzia sp. THAF187b]CTQ44254.1 HTH-type transcriptional regulator YofA [Roseibium aggregatum]
MNNLDSELLRTFLAVAGTGSVTEGARLIGRSQSATSLQIMRLEEVIGRDLFERTGRGVTLTETGQRLMPVARDVKERLDAVLREITADGLRGKLRLGIPDDHGQAKLAKILSAFAQSHPQVELEVTCTISTDFPELLSRGRLDLAVYEVETIGRNEEVVFEDPTCWVMSRYRDLLAEEPVPVALFDRACWWREAALKSLEARGRPYRIAFSSQSVAGVTAAVEAGIAIGLLGRSTLAGHLKVLGNEHGFASTPMSKLVIGVAASANQDLVRTMKSAIRQAF